LIVEVSLLVAVTRQRFTSWRRGARFYSCLTARSDALFELADAVLRGDGPVRSPTELSPVGEHRRGHGRLYTALAVHALIPAGSCVICFND
jgi:hypothetical protein